MTSSAFTRRIRLAIFALPFVYLALPGCDGGPPPPDSVKIPPPPTPVATKPGKKKTRKEEDEVLSGKERAALEKAKQAGK